MTEREALKLALEAFEAIPEEIEGWIPDKCTDAVIAAKEALAQKEQEFTEHPPHRHCECVDCVEYFKLEQEPVAFDTWYENAIWGNEDFKAGCKRSWNAAIKHTAPPQRTWVGLTDIDYAGLPLEQVGLVRWAEAKLKEKNT